MPFDGGWLRDHYYRFICLYLRNSRTMFGDKNIITQDAKFSRYPLTTDQKENQFFF